MDRMQLRRSPPSAHSEVGSERLAAVAGPSGAASTSIPSGPQGVLALIDYDGSPAALLRCWGTQAGASTSHRRRVSTDGGETTTTCNAELKTH